jgi:hypothetical protein
MALGWGVCLFPCLLALISLISGCASLKVPAIDPTGSQIFLPNQKTEVLHHKKHKLFGKLHHKQKSAPPTGPYQPIPFSTAPLPAGPTPVPAGTTPVFPQSSGPAFQHPVEPPPCDSDCGSGKKLFHQAGFHKQKHLIPKPTGHKSAGQKGELLMTPSKIIAPVGSEVVVLAGICGSDGYFVKNQPLEWMLSNDSVGQIVEVGGMQHSTFNKIVPPTAGKKSGQYAHGRTGLKNIVLTRGTPTPVDDIELKEGQTYISVMSASPGTSYITGYAPQAEGWDRRIASTIIHWVDGIWSIPAPGRATAGTVYPLTTVVNRTADAGGIEGWIVRYSIVGGAPAEFAPAGSQTAETQTNRDGQGTVQIRQQAGQLNPGTTQVRVDVVRPGMFGQPELIVESGITTVTWSSPALTIRAIGPRAAGVDEPFNYRVEVSNPGDLVARGVVVKTKNLDESVEFISSNPKPTEFGRQLEWNLGDIPPGSPPLVIDAQFKSKKRGNVGMCFEVVSDADRLRTEACTETEIRLPCIGLSVDGPTFARVGESVSYRLNVLNQCDEPLEDLRVTIRTDAGLLNPGYSNPVSFQLDRLQTGENRFLPLTLMAQSVGSPCFDIEIVARNGHTAVARRCINIGEPALEQARDQLQIELRGGAPMVVGGNSLVTAVVTNRGNTPFDSVLLTNRMSPSIVAVDLTAGLPFSWAKDDLQGNDQLFVNLGRLEPQQSKEVMLRYEGLNVDAEAVSELTASTPLGATATDRIRLRVEPARPGDTPGGPIRIPGDPGGAVGQGELTVQLQANSETIQLRNSLNPVSTVPSQAEIQILISNRSNSILRDVEVLLLTPPEIEFIGFDPGQSNLVIDGRNEASTQFRVSRIRELRPGETVRLGAIVQGARPGTTSFGVRADSLDAPTAGNTVSLVVIP